MKKSAFFFIILVFLLAIVVLINSLLSGIKPAVLPPTQKITDLSGEQSEKQGAPVELPLIVPPGFRIGIFAKDLGKVRGLAFSPSGTLFISGMDKGQVIALPDRNRDGVADETKTLVEKLHNPHDLAFYNGKLFVAEETRVVRYNFDEKNLTASRDKVLFSLPGGGRHFTRSLAFNKNGDLFVSIGSTCDVCFEKHDFLAAVIVSNADDRTPRLFAKGLRNSVFIAVNPETNELWGADMGRDFLGDELPPDEVNIIKDGRDYGWPVCYGDRVYDAKFGERSPSYCQNTEVPVYKIPAHSAPLGLAFIHSKTFPKDFQGDLLVAYHGSWNRSTPIGYKVVRMKVEGNKVTGEEDFITGFIKGEEALGRPVDLAFNAEGNLFVSDDKAGVVYIVTNQL